MYAIYGVPFTINKKPSHVSIFLPYIHGAIHGSVMGNVKSPTVLEHPRFLGSHMISHDITCAIF